MECGLPPFGPSASWDVLRRRAEMLAELRSFFAQRGFLEVETPLLCRDSVVDLHIEPFAVDVSQSPGERWWLQTSPEFCMKRMLAAGATAIYQVTRAFRQGEVGTQHNPEFTMVEWYRRGDDMWAGMRLLAELARVMLSAESVLQIEYAELFQRGTGIDPLDATDEALRDAARSLGLQSARRSTRDDCLDFLFATRAVPALPADVPAIVYYYPASQAALSRLDPRDDRRAERFELFFRGIELANGYHELTDAAEWRRRAETANRRRVSRGRREVPVDSALMSAMEAGLPAGSGTALGFDRLVMAALGRESLAEVMAFPWERA